MIGRLNPQTGEIKLVSPPTPRTNPSGIVLDSKGTPWFVQFNVNKLASINPNTMEIKEYTLPNPDTRPRRIAITNDDIKGLLPKAVRLSETESPSSRRRGFRFPCPTR